MHCLGGAVLKWGVGKSGANKINREGGWGETDPMDVGGHWLGKRETGVFQGGTRYVISCF